MTIPTSPPTNLDHSRTSIVGDDISIFMGKETRGTLWGVIPMAKPSAV
jgi:hypothetical protein